MAVPFPQLGKHTTIFTIQGMSVTTGGVLAPAGTAVSIWGVRRGHNMSGNVNSSEINSASRPFDNEVPISTGLSLNIEIFKVNNGTDPNPLETLWGLYDYVQASWTAGTIAGGIEAKTFVGSRGNLSVEDMGRGEGTSSLELRPIDAGWAATSAGAGAPGQLTRTIS